MRRVLSLVTVDIHRRLVSGGNVIHGTRQGHTRVRSPEQVTHRPPTEIESPEGVTKRERKCVNHDDGPRGANRAEGRVNGRPAEYAQRGNDWASKGRGDGSGNHRRRSHGRWEQEEMINRTSGNMR